jgi:hypothetical protein
MSNNHDVTIREANGDDGAAIERLAQLDSSRPPAGPTLIAEIGDEPRAAYSLSEQRAIANPFRRTAELVELLRVHARQLDGTRGRRMPQPSAPQPPGFGIGFVPGGLGRKTA